MAQDLRIDEQGAISAATEEARLRLARAAGPRALFESAPDLLLALRSGAEGLVGDLRQLEPRAAVLAGDLGEVAPSDLLNFLHQGRRTGVLLARADGVERGLDTEALLLDGLRRLDEMELFRGRIPSSHVQLRRSGNLPAPGLLDEGALRLLELCDGALTLAQLAAASALGEFEATKATYKLLSAGFVVLDG